MNSSSTSNNSSPASLLDIYGVNQISLELIGLVGVRFATGTLGMFTSMALIYITIRNKNLHGTCNLFIASQAFFEFLTMANFAYSLFLALIGQNLITLGHCMPILCWSSFANLMRKLALYLVSLDRLLMVSFPMIFARKPILFYWFSMGIATAYSLFVLYMTWVAAVDPNNVDKMVTCTVSDLTDTGPVGTFVLVNGLVIVGLSVSNYAILWAILRWKADESEKGKTTRQYTRQIFKMLLVLTGLAIFGWMLNPLIRVILAHLEPNARQKFYISITLSSTSNVSMLLDAPVLYWFSKDYRNAFRKAFGKMLRLPAPVSTKIFTKINNTQNPGATAWNSQQRASRPSMFPPTTTTTNFGTRKLTMT